MFQTDLEKDAVFQAKIQDPQQRAYIYEEQSKDGANKVLPATAYKATAIFLLGIVVIALFGSFPKELLPLVPNSKGVWAPLSMTPTIQLCMLVIAALILLVCKVKVNDVTNGSVFKSGMVAIVSVFSTRVAVLGNKMRYLFPAFLRYSNCTQDDVALSASLAVIYGAELLPTEGLL